MREVKIEFQENNIKNEIFFQDDTRDRSRAEGILRHRFRQQDVPVDLVHGRISWRKFSEASDTIYT